MKSNDFLAENLVDDAHDMHTDHEVQMARGECYHAAESAIALHKMLRNVSEQQGLDGWVSAKITLANDYLNTVREYLEYQLMTMNSDVSQLPIAEGTEGELNTGYMNQQNQDFYDKNPNFKRSDREKKFVGNQLASKVMPTNKPGQVTKKPITSFKTKGVAEGAPEQKTFRVIYRNLKTGSNHTRNIIANNKNDVVSHFTSKGLDVVGIKDIGVSDKNHDERRLQYRDYGDIDDEQGVAEGQLDELSPSTLGSYAKKANAARSYEPDDRKADNRGTGVMKSLDRIAGKKSGPLKGKAVTARWASATGAKDSNKSREKFEKGVDKASGVAEGRMTHGPGGVPLDRQGNPKVARPAMPKLSRMAEPEPELNLDKIWFDVTNIIGNIFPDGDPADYLPKYCRKHGCTYDDIRAAARKHGYDDEYAYIDELKTGDYGYNEGVTEGFRWLKKPWMSVVVRGPASTHGLDTAALMKLPMQQRAERYGYHGGPLFAFANRKDANYFILKFGGEVVKDFQQGVTEGVTSPEIKQAYDAIMQTEPRSPERRAAIAKYQKLRALALKKKGVAEGSLEEVSDKTLINYLTKVDADSRKHKMDPTKRDPKKASKSVTGFSKAFNKLDSRKEQGVTEVSKATLDRYVAKAVDAHGHAAFSSRMSKDDPSLRSYHKGQAQTAEKRRQGISRALDRMPKTEGVAEGSVTQSGITFPIDLIKNKIEKGTWTTNDPVTLGADIEINNGSRTFLVRVVPTYPDAKANSNEFQSNDTALAMKYDTRFHESASAGASGAGSIAGVTNPGGKAKSKVGTLFGGTYHSEDSGQPVAKTTKTKKV